MNRMNQFSAFTSDRIIESTVELFSKGQRSFYSNNDDQVAGQQQSDKQPPRFYNPFTYRDETEEELWTSLGNWDL